jgi:glutamate-1-semialdehyde 2,1-aminomutase
VRGVRRRAEDHGDVSPVGPVYQAGTLSGNPLAMACGLATLEIMKEPARTTRWSAQRQSRRGLIDAARTPACPSRSIACGQHDRAVLRERSGKPVLNFADATASDTDRYAKFFHAMLDHGVYLAPSQYEALFVGLAHDDEAIERTIDAASKAFKAVA